MVKVELNGFDESGNIGGKLRFIRVGMNATCELRPFVYNLLHFGSITASKATLKGQVNEIKLHYLRNILADQNIDVNCYDFPIEKQLELVRYFTLGEFTKIANIRNGYLITAFKETDPEKIKKRLSTAISKLRKYTYPHKYIESYVKSYAYRMIFEVLEKKSRIYKETPSKKCKLISFVDGGYPFTFWKEELIKQKETDGVFLPNTISINGLSNGDEYFPMINIAGTIATILNFVPKANYPHNILEVPEVTKEIKTKFYQNFTEKYEKPTFYPRILFFGHIDRDLQYTLPYVLYRKTHEKLYEPFRVRGSFKSFYKAFKGDSTKDMIICGKKRKKAQDEKMYKECKDYGLDVVDCCNYYDGFNKLLDDITEESKNSNLDHTSIQKIKNRIKTTKERVKRSF